MWSLFSNLLSFLRFVQVNKISSKSFREETRGAVAKCRCFLLLTYKFLVQVLSPSGVCRTKRDT